MKTRHDGDCSIYACLINNTPEAGICTCGYGHQLIITGNYSEMYSRELEEKLESKNKGGLLDAIKFNPERSLKSLKTLLQRSVEKNPLRIRKQNDN